MPNYERQHIRFSLDIPAIRFTNFGEKIATVLLQISIGGCLLEWDENIYTGEVFRLEIQLPNKNWLPLFCRVLYKFENNGIGAKFIDISGFEQKLVGKIITFALEQEGLPVPIDPFAQPPKFDIPGGPIEPKITDRRRQNDLLLEEIMSSDVK